MPSMFRRRGATARAVLVLALVVAVAAVAVPAAAQPIATTSASIAKTVKRALNLSKAADKRSVRALKVAQGAQKQLGPQGPQGQQGPKGDPGPQGAPGVSGLQVAVNQTAEDSTDSKGLTVDCPAGKKVFGGGASVTGSQDPNIGVNVAIGASGPFVSANNQVLPSDAGWRAEAHEDTATAEGWQLTVYAICGNAN